MTQQTPLKDARSALNTHRNTFLASAWDYLGLELKNALESIPDTPNHSQDREAAQMVLDSWNMWPDGWKAFGSAERNADPPKSNLLRLLGDLIKA